MFWKLHWGARTTEDQTTDRCWLCLPPSAQGHKVPSQLLRYLRWVCVHVVWWDIKIRLLCHVAPQQKDSWDMGIISLIPLKSNHFLQRWYQYLLCDLPISNPFYGVCISLTWFCFPLTWMCVCVYIQYIYLLWNVSSEDKAWKAAGKRNLWPGLQQSLILSQK